MNNNKEFLDENMLAIFLSDSDDYLKTMANEILIIEKNPESKNSIDLIFRAIHSIKGAAGILRMNVLTEVSHRYETLLDKVRSGKLEITKEMVEFLLDGIEIFNKLMEHIKSKKEDITFEEMKKYLGVSKEEFVENAERFLPKNKQVGKTENIIEKEHEVFHKKGGAFSYKIDVELFEDEIMKKARTFMVYNTLSSVGNVYQSVPSIDEIQNDDFEVDSSSCFFMETDKDKHHIEKILSTFEIKNFNVAENMKKREKVVLTPKEEAEPIEIKKEETKVVPKENVKEEIAEVEKKPIVESKKIEDDKKQKINKSETDTKLKEFIKVEKEKLDNLFNIVGELFIEKSVYSQMHIKLGEIYSELSEHGIPQKTLKNLAVYLDSLNLLNKKQERELSELQEVSNSLRMIPIKESFSSYGMAVRMLSSKLKKKVELEIKGEDTELDKLISEKLTDPILHMIRNSLDHGIETPEERKAAGKPEVSKLILVAFNSGNDVIIKIIDDGKGIDVEKISEKAIEKGLITIEDAKKMTHKEKLDIIFLPGFSTADQVSDISGRGVGMDVVKRNIDMVKGKVEIETEVGKGTTFTIKIPLTLAIIRALLVTAGKNIYAFSSDTAVTVEKVLKEKVDVINNVEVMKFREQVVPIFSLNKIFGSNMKEITSFEESDESKSKHYKVLVLKQGVKLYGFKVDDFLNQQYIVVKNIEGTYHKGKAIIGAAVLGDGSLSMVVDTNDLIDNINSHKFNIEI